MDKTEMKVGFTGTRDGLTRAQQGALMVQLIAMRPEELHHGDCIGADAFAVLLASGLGIRIIAHPPDNKRWRGHAVSHVVLPVKPYLERNHDIVDATDALIACPNSAREEWRSGTWATIRYAKRMGKPVHLITP